jgi:hypothetical protein
MKYLMILWLVFFGIVALEAQTRLINLANDSNMKYGKVSVDMVSGEGAVVVYQAASRSNSSGEIYGALVEWGDVVSLGNLSSSSTHSLEQDVAVSPSGRIHVVWFESLGSHRYELKYRTITGTSPSGIVSLGTITADGVGTHNGIGVEDLRLDADDSNNIAVVWMSWHSGGALCYLATRYSGQNQIEAFPLGQRAKHPCVVMDSSNIHVSWQYRGSFTGNVYSIVYARRPNRLGAKFETPIDLRHTEAQRPKIELDRNGNPHVVYFEEHHTGMARQIYYQYRTGFGVSGARSILGNPSRPESFHFLDFQVHSSNDMVMTSQAGGYSAGNGVMFNWKLNGKWTGYGALPLSGRPASQSTAMSKSKPLIVVGYADSDRAVMVYTDKRGPAFGENPGPDPDPDPVPIPNVPPVARILLSPTSGIYPLNVSFNGNASSDSDGRIVSFNWSMGDGSTRNESMFTHLYQRPGTYTITLKVTDDDGASSTATAALTVFGMEPPLKMAFNYHQNRNLFSVEHYYRVTWENNPLNAQFGFNVVRYNIYRRKKGESTHLHIAKVPRKEGVLEFLDRSLKNTFVDYEYAVTCEDVDGRQSSLNMESDNDKTGFFTAEPLPNRKTPEKIR